MRWLVLTGLLVPASVNADVLIATRTLPAGTVLQPDDISIREEGQPGVPSPEDVVGLQTKVAIYEGRPIQPGRLTAAYLVARNQLVTLAYETPLMRIETEGRALDSGQAGQVIRVMNLSSRTTVSGRVEPDGTIVIQQK